MAPEIRSVSVDILSHKDAALTRVNDLFFHKLQGSVHLAIDAVGGKGDQHFHFICFKGCQKGIHTGTSVCLPGRCFVDKQMRVVNFDVILLGPFLADANLLFDAVLESGGKAA